MTCDQMFNEIVNDVQKLIDEFNDVASHSQPISYQFNDAASKVVAFDYVKKVVLEAHRDKFVSICNRLSQI
jgi:hypothetical protein